MDFWNILGIQRQKKYPIEDFWIPEGRFAEHQNHGANVLSELRYDWTQKFNTDLKISPGTWNEWSTSSRALIQNQCSMGKTWKNENQNKIIREIVRAVKYRTPKLSILDPLKLQMVLKNRV